MRDLPATAELVADAAFAPGGETVLYELAPFWGRDAATALWRS